MLMLTTLAAVELLCFFFFFLAAVCNLLLLWPLQDADKNIIKWLKEHGRLVNASSFKHNYPFCWR